MSSLKGPAGIILLLPNCCFWLTVNILKSITQFYHLSKKACVATMFFLLSRHVRFESERALPPCGVRVLRIPGVDLHEVHGRVLMYDVALSRNVSYTARAGQCAMAPKSAAGRASRKSSNAAQPPGCGLIGGFGFLGF